MRSLKEPGKSVGCRAFAADAMACIGNVFYFKSYSVADAVGIRIVVRKIRAARH